MVLFESGEGGQVGGGIEAVAAIVKAHGGDGWVLGCRPAASTPGPRGGPLCEVVEVTLLCAFGEPDPRAVAPALRAAARRQRIQFRLVVRGGTQVR